ncbi:winged helix-turn-helix domain-containing protein [Micromonospora sp. NPDC049679]|uniref:winged helix-turn-helix domain-containing protein n=1 Tax=Micromonospora sp. NPDC049679 TaxID=3155920 RepID=UPI00340DFD35
MSVIAISPRAYQSSGASRVPRQPAVGGDGSAPSLTVTFDISLAGETLTPQAFRLLELVRDLVDQGEARVTVGGGPVRPPLPGGPIGRVATTDPGDAPAVRIFAASRTVTRAGERVPLTRLEFDLLLFLVEHPRRVFTRRQLLSGVWGYENAVARTVDVHVRRLRAKLGERVPMVTTVYGVGYRLADDARVGINRDG